MSQTGKAYDPPETTSNTVTCIHHYPVIPKGPDSLDPISALLCPIQNNTVKSA